MSEEYDILKTNDGLIQLVRCKQCGYVVFSTDMIKKWNEYTVCVWCEEYNKENENELQNG